MSEGNIPAIICQVKACIVNNYTANQLFCKNIWIEAVDIKRPANWETPVCTAFADKSLNILLPTPYFKKFTIGKGKAMVCQYRIMKKANLENNTHTKLTV